MKKMNARLEWKGRRLMCNGLCVAGVVNLGIKTPPWWAVYRDGDTRHKTEAAARRAVNRRFGIKE